MKVLHKSLSNKVDVLFANLRTRQSSSSKNFCTTQVRKENKSLWRDLEVAPLDGNHETASLFEKDPSPLKVNLGRGVYKDDNGKSWVLPSVLQVFDLNLNLNYQ